MALDLGGTNFRVLLIHLKGENDFEMQSKIYAIPQMIMLGSGTQLFDHIAECLANFMRVRLISNTSSYYCVIGTVYLYCILFSSRNIKLAMKDYP